MVWPIVAVAGATALAQMYQSEKARGANAKTLAQMKADFDKLVPPGYNISIMDPPQYIKDKIPEPSMDMSSVTPEQYKLVGKYKPEIASYIEEQRPDLVKDTAGMKEGREAQLGALRKLKSIGDNQEGDPELRQAIANAGRQSQMQAQSRQQSILQDLARRGMMGSGAGLAAQMQGGSDAMSNAARSSQDAAVASYRNRLQALKDSASLGGQVRDADFQQERGNIDIINDFNQRTSKNRQAWEQSRAGNLNEAQKMNLAAEQQVSDANVGQNNRANYGERDRRDRLNQYLYGVRRNEQDRQNSMIESEANWKRGERDNENNLKSRQYDDQYRKLSGQHGAATQGMSQLNQATADRNQAIQGFGNAVVGGISEYQDRTDRQEDREDRRKYYGY